MSYRTIIGSYTHFNHWANERLVHWLRSLEQELLYRQVRSSFGSIDLTLQHMIHAQNFWYAAITERNPTQFHETIRVNEVDVVMNELVEGSKKMFDRYAAYTDEELLKQLPSTELLQSRYEYILHVVNHNSYHRGQVVTLARNVGVTGEIPFTDYDAFLWCRQYGKL
jgi:uncharacterized damage-inducible protein DinB